MMFPPRRNHRQRLAILTAILSMHNCISFQSSPIPASFIPSSSRQQRIPSLRAVESPMRPIEDEQEKTTESRSLLGSRFVPKLFKRKSPEQDSRILTVDTLAEYKAQVVNQNTLVVVRFYAPWCKSCKASFPLLKQLMSKYPEVKYVQVPLTKETAYIHEGLGVKSVPFAHIYHPEGGLVEEKKINKRVFGEFAKALGWYVQGECDLNDYTEIEEDGFQ